MSKLSRAPKSAVSSTELGMYYACPRKWAAKYATDDPEWKEDRKAHFAVGTAIHKLAEAYSLQGFVPRDPHPIIDLWIHALKHVAHPRTHWAIEQKLELDIHGLPFEITPDWYGPSDALPGAPKGIRAVLDYKSSVNPKKYGLFEEAKKLADFQTVIYSHVLFGDQPGVFRHLYMRKSSQVLMLEAQELPAGPERDKAEAKALKQPMSQLAIPADVVLSPGDVTTAMERMVLPVAEKVYQIRSRGIAINPLDLDPNAGHCSEYGGCPHRQRCNLTPEQVLMGAMGVTDMSGFDLFSQIPAINGAPNVAVPVAVQGFAMPAPAAPAPVAFAMPAPAAPIEELPPGYKLSDNPAFLYNPQGAYEDKAQVLAAFAAYKQAQPTVAVATLALTPPQPAPVAAPAQVMFTSDEITKVRKLLSLLA